VAIVLSVLLWFTDSDYPFGILWPLCCLFYFDSRILIILLVYCGHCVVCFTLIHGFWLPLWYLVAIVLSVLLWFTDSDYPFGILWPLCCLFYFDSRILIIPLVSCSHCVVCSTLIHGFWLSLWYLVAIVFSVLLWFTDSNYPFSNVWPLCFLLSRTENTMATRNQRDNQNPRIKVKQTTQWPQNTKRIIRIRESK
jgi:uncharacterized protein (DUF3820 family)